MKIDARLIALAALVLVAVAPRASIAADTKPRPPNIVILLADDMGFSDLGCFGSEIETPAIDKLAAGGVRFTQFYNTGRCWPTRASIMTGLDAHQAHMAMPLGPKAPPGYTGVMVKSQPMIPELLAAAGYRTYHVGKWHIDNRQRGPNESWPLGRGFLHSYLVLDHDNYFAPKVMYRDAERLTKLPPDYYLTDAMADEAIARLKEHAADHADAPFFLYLAFTAPHFPLHARANDVAHYRGKYRAGWDAVRAARYERLRSQNIIDCALSPRDDKAKAWAELTSDEQDAWDARMA